MVTNKKGCCDDCGLDDCMPEGGVKMVGDVEETGSLGGDLYCIFCSAAAARAVRRDRAAGLTTMRPIHRRAAAAAGEPLSYSVRAAA